MHNFEVHVRKTWLEKVCECIVNKHPPNCHIRTFPKLLLFKNPILTKVLNPVRLFKKFPTYQIRHLFGSKTVEEFPVNNIL